MDSKPWERFYKKGVILIIVGLAVANGVFIAGWFGVGNIFEDKAQVWFQRSGSVGTALLVTVDYYIYKLSSDLNQIHGIGMSAIKVKDKYRPLVKVISFVALSLTIMSTLIWGYGDLIYIEITNRL